MEKATGVNIFDSQIFNLLKFYTYEGHSVFLSLRF